MYFPSSSGLFLFLSGFDPGRFLPGLRQQVRPDLDPGSPLAFHIFPGDRYCPDIIILGDLIHDIQHEIFNDGPEGPGAGIPFQGLRRDRVEGIILELQFHLIQGQQFLILFEDGVPGLPQDPDQHVLIQSLHGAEDGKPAQEFRDHAEFLEVIIGDLVKNVLIAVIFILQFRAEPKRGSAGQTFPDNVLQIRKSAAADKEDISGIDGGQGHHAALAAGADRDFHFRPFQELEHALLDRFTADIPGIDILLFGDLIDLIHKDNALLTFFHVIVRRFQELGDHALDIIADIAGYIGDDIESVISKLLEAADNDVEKCEKGIVFVDEIDKIAKKKNVNSRDVSGESVQQGMLKLLEGAEVEVPVGASSKSGMVPLTTVDTRNILFICGGAFPDLENIVRERLTRRSSLGFGAELKDKYDSDKNILDKVTNDDLKKFGMIPEFLGRLPILCTMKGLDEDMLVRILREPRNAILKQYQKLLALDEVKLEFEDDALHAIAAKALERDTGARALRSIIEDFMLDIMYEIPKDDNIGTVTITREYVEGKGGPRIEIRSDLLPEAGEKPARIEAGKEKEES